MGTPTSTIFCEIYLEYLDNITIFHILTKHHILGYFLHVDDILLVQQNSITNIHEVINTCNNLTPTTHFTMEEVFENERNFLDTTISKDGNNIQFSLYRILNETDIIISNNSYDPPPPTPETKLAAVRYLTKHLSTNRVNSTEKEIKIDTIKKIRHNNNNNNNNNNKYVTTILNKVSRTKENEKEQKKKKSQTRWVKFTCVGKQTKLVTTLF